MFALTWVSLFCTPIASLVLFNVFRRHRAGAWRLIAWASVAILLATTLLTGLGFSFAIRAASVGWLLMCYGAYCVIAVSGLLIRMTTFRILLLIVVSVPMLAGYFLCTIGIIGLVFIVGIETAPAFKSEQISDGLACHFTWWGMAATDSGYTLHLDRSWTGLPFLQQEVAWISVNQTAGDRETTCSALLAAWRY